MLTLVLTQADADDLRDSNTINAMTQEGVEVVARPDAFIPLVWSALDSGNPVSLDMEIIGQSTFTEVIVTVEAGKNVSTFLNQWCVARLKDSRESGEIDRDVSDAVIEREAERLEVQVFQLASTFVDNEFNEKE